MTTKVAIDPWSEEALFAKAQLYIQKMETYTPDDWEYGFWSALAIELVARAALAHISPVLLADNKDWQNLTYALGHEPTTMGFSPRSITTKEVIGRLAKMKPEVTQEIVGFCAQHQERRNTELHSGELAFSGLGTSKWLSSFYLALKTLLAVMGKELQDFVSNPGDAITMIEALKDESARVVGQDIKAHQQSWSNKSDEEKEIATAQATTWATRHAGHRVICPSCGSPALLQGSPSGVVSTQIDQREGQIVQRQRMLPTSFECVACSLRIHGLSKLTACGLGGAFTGMSFYTPEEFFNLYTEYELEQARAEGNNAFEQDFNEY